MNLYHQLTGGRPCTLIDILGTITFVLLIVASAGGISWLIMRRVDKVLLQRAADKAKKRKNVDSIDFTYDSKGRKQDRRELWEGMRREKGK